MSNLPFSSLFLESEVDALHLTVEKIITHYPENYFAQRLKKVVYCENTSFLDLLLSIKDYFDFNNHGLIQFYHRNIAYLIVAYVLLMGLTLITPIMKFKNDIVPHCVIALY